MRACLLLLVGACHAQIAGSGVDAGSGSNPDIDGDVGDIDASPDAPPIMLGPWSAPTPITNAATGAAEDDATLAWNGNELIFARDDGDTKHLYYMSRPDAGSPFSTPVLASFSAGPDQLEQSPRFSPDDLTLYFASDRGGNDDIWMVTRPTIGGAWQTPTRVLTTASAATEKWYAPCGADRYMLIRNVDNQGDIFEGVAGAPVKVAALSSTSGETGTFITQNCLEVYFASTRDGTNDLFHSTRTAPDQSWAAPTKVTAFGTLDNEQDPWLSADGRIFVFASDAGGNGDNDIYISTRSPL